VIEHPRLFLGEDHDPPGSVGEAFEHVTPPGFFRGAGAPRAPGFSGGREPPVPPGRNPYCRTCLGDLRTPSYPRGRSSASGGAHNAPSEAPHGWEYTPDPFPDRPRSLIRCPIAAHPGACRAPLPVSDPYKPTLSLGYSDCRGLGMRASTIGHPVPPPFGVAKFPRMGRCRDHRPAMRLPNLVRIPPDLPGKRGRP